MPNYKVTGPDGRVYRVTAPEGATQDDVIAYVQKNYAEAQKPAKQDQTVAKAEPEAPSPLGSNTDNFLAGVGKALTDTGRGIAQTALALPAAVQRNAPDFTKEYLPDALNADTYYQRLKQDQARANQLDQPLMDSKAGLAGDIVGNVGIGLVGGGAAKAAGVAGSVLPNTYGGAAIAGGLLGATQPIAGDQTELSRLGNVAAGSAGGIVGRVVPNAIAAAVKGGVGLAAPLFSRGQDSIAAKAIARFGGDAVSRAMPSVVPGVTADIAEQTGDAGLAQLRRAVTDADPAIARQFAEQQAQNNAARLGLLRQVAGTPDDVANARAWRDQVANAKYGQAFDDARSQQVARSANASDAASEASLRKILSMRSTEIPAGSGTTAKMQELSKRPIIQSAVQQAKAIAANAGVDIGDPLNSLQGQHYIKMALDDALNTAPQMGIGKAQQSAIASAKREFVDELERQNPAYKSARESFRDMSGPANRMEIAQGLLNRATGNAADIDSLGNPVLRPDAYGRAVDSLDKIAQQVTGQKNASAGTILNQQQKDAIQKVLGDLSRVKVANNTGKSAGSNTVQNLASQNVLNELASGLGLPGLADSSILGSVANFANKGYGLLGVPDKIKDKLAQAVLDPSSKESRAILKAAAKYSQKPTGRGRLADLSAGIGGLLGIETTPVATQSMGGR